MAFGLVCTVLLNGKLHVDGSIGCRSPPGTSAPEGPDALAIMDKVGRSLSYPQLPVAPVP